MSWTYPAGGTATPDRLVGISGGGRVGVLAAPVLCEWRAFLEGDGTALHQLGSAAGGRQDDRAAGVRVGERCAKEAGLGGDEHGVRHR